MFETPSDDQKHQNDKPQNPVVDAKTPFLIHRRQFVKGIAGTGLALAWFGVFPAKALARLAQENANPIPKNWWFVHGSDSHSNAGPDIDPMEVFLSDVKKAFPQTAFLIDTGDITEHGWEEELDRSRAAIENTYDKPVYAIMGNHDARWSRAGRYAFRNRFGDIHWVIEQENLAVILLDGSVLLEQYGHIDPSELVWLETQLKKLGGKAAMIGFHHPPCDPAQFLDSDQALFRLLARYNVLAVLAGHILARSDYKVNGIQVVTSGGVVSPKAVYCAWEITGENAVLYERNPVKNEIRKVLSIPLNPRQRGMTMGPLDELKSRKIFGKWHLSAPNESWSAGVDVMLNGKLMDTTSLVAVHSKKLKLELKDLSSGHYEIATIAPKLGVSDMQWRWGDIYKKPDDSVKLRWEITLPAGIQSKPVIYKNRVIIGTNSGVLYARDVTSGNSAWEYNSGADAILSSPVIHKERLYFGTIGECIVCLDPATGHEIWTSPVDGSVIATARIAGESLIVGTGKGCMLALAPEDGTIRWRYKVGNLIKATPAYDGSNLYFGAWDGKFYAVNAATGTEVWVKEMTTPHLSPATCNPGALDGRIIVVTHDYATHCLDSKTGDELWRFPQGYDKFDWQSPLIAKCKPSYSSPVFYKGVAYMTSITGHVVGFDVVTGEQRLELEIGEDIFDSFPVLVGNQFYFGTLRGKFVGANLDTGKLSRAYSLGPDFIFSPPGFGEGAIFLGNMGGRLACFGE